ncbi:MAG TPA: peptidase T [Candidatus Flavonifractor merdigallinarum]|uniref:Peptidase T n=1 Tax=Candidatus Flavonifractor merdigallinarum TaxID=2838589 RepID=A0A9D2C052_9FIRM|nr:peptidase T [Candidatus Flavonifractor merdigallinarum]
MKVAERFLRYVAINTQSAPGQEAIPSTACQWDLARLLAEELRELGVADAHVDAHGYVMGALPSNLPAGQSAPALGLIAHMDTATECSGAEVKPRIVPHYDGGVIVLSEDGKCTMSPQQYASLKKHIGEDLIVTDGSTLLGADNKAGVAEIMAVVEWFQSHPEVPHGKLCIGFTPDEEVGRGADAFDLEAFGAEVAYTVDGGELGELEYETFNAAAAQVTITGTVIHPGYAKDKMKNAALIAARFQAMLPEVETPAHTEGYEGFYHLQQIEGDVAQATITYLIRDYDKSAFEARKGVLRRTAQALNQIYGPDTVQISIEDTYYNMRERIEPHMELIELAQAAMEETGIQPLIVPVRGGTDGARLSYLGLPCPNLCCGALNTHGPYEYCSIQDMEKIVAMLICLVRKFGGNSCET